MILKWLPTETGELVWAHENPELKAKFTINDGFVSKVNPRLLGSDWKTKMECILLEWHPPGFEFIDNGYKVPLVIGTDLHGNKPFSYDNSINQCSYDTRYLPSINAIYGTLLAISEATGVTFADASPSNIILDANSNQAHLIDFDCIESLSNPGQRRVWDYNRELIFNHNIRVI